MDMVEILGYIAMILVAGSFLLKDVVKLRIVNAIGAACFVIYGLLIGSFPVTGLNIFVVCVNGYYIWKSLNIKATA
ncbi:lactate dehydrogenase [Pasteurellaceae bacterium 15-036681]|nr:lactate dehydrogenase [Pasteurellaceae bacterium 15-036681]